MKKSILVLFMLVLVFAFVSCDNSKDVPADDKVDVNPAIDGRLEITNEAELIAAAIESGKYYLANDIKLENELKITAEDFDLYGNGMTISRDMKDVKSEDGIGSSVILICANNAKLSNLVIDCMEETLPTDWQTGAWAIKAYNGKEADLNVALENITVKNMFAAIQANGATITVSGEVKFENCFFGLCATIGNNVKTAGRVSVNEGTVISTDSYPVDSPDGGKVFIAIYSEDGGEVTFEGVSTLVEYPYNGMTGYLLEEA